MGTRSDIIVHCADGKWKRIYCHWNGYLSHNGKLLFDHYTNQKQAEALVNLGSISSLGEIIGVKHSFEWRDKLYQQYKKGPIGDDYEARDNAMRADPLFIKYERMCLVYHRDRNKKWEDVKPDEGDTLQSVWPEEDTWTEFTYVWDEGKWWVTDPDEGTQTLTDLGDALTGERTVRPSVKVFGAKIAHHAKHDPGPPKPMAEGMTVYVAPVVYKSKGRRAR